MECTLSTPASQETHHPRIDQASFERLLGEVEDRACATLEDHGLPPRYYGHHYFQAQPELPRTDFEFEAETRSLKHNVKRYCKEFYGYEVTYTERSNFCLSGLAERQPELMDFVEYVADGGNNWNDLFTKGLYRWNLVYGILSLVLQKWVFPHTMFGATEDQLSSVQNIDTQFLTRDAFDRTSVRSAIIRTFLSPQHSSVTPKFFEDANTLTYRIHALLLPLLAIHRPGTAFRPAPEKNYDIRALNALFPIIYQAAKLSLDMRREGPQIYFFRSILKRELWDEETMSCKNKEEIESGDLVRDDSHVRLVKITGFPEVTVYLPGKVGNPVVDKLELGHEEQGTGRETRFNYGSRSCFTARRICRATALLGWGLMGRSGTGLPSGKTLQTAIEEDRKKARRREEEDRQEMVDWWTRYATLPAWGVRTGISARLPHPATSVSNV